MSNCEHLYSRTIDQEYPRKCLKCGEREPDRSSVMDEDRNAPTLPEKPISASPGNDELLQFFVPDPRDNPVTLQVTDAFDAFAKFLVWRLPYNREKSVAVRKLMEARDSAARAARLKS